MYCCCYCFGRATLGFTFPPATRFRSVRSFHSAKCQAGSGNDPCLNLWPEIGHVTLADLNIKSISQHIAFDMPFSHWKIGLNTDCLLVINKCKLSWKRRSQSRARQALGVSPVIIITRASNYIRKRLSINSAMRMHLAFAIVFIITEGGRGEAHQGASDRYKLWGESSASLC